MDLYRKEALDSMNSPSGRPLGLRDYSTSRLVALLSVLAIAGLTFISLATFSRKETVTGSVTLSAGMPLVVSPTSGVIESVQASNGTPVKAGSILFKVRSEQKDSDGQSSTVEVNRLRREEYEAQRRNLLTELDKASIRQTELSETLRSIRDRYSNEQVAASLREKRRSLSEVTYKNFEVLAKQQMVSGLELTRTESAMLEAQEAVVQSRQQLAMLRSEERSAAASLSAIGPEIESIRAKIDAHDAQSAASRAMAGTDSHFSVVSEVAGTVTSLSKKAGDYVTAGSPLAVILPANSDVYVDLMVPSGAIGFAEIGTPVKVMIDAFPYQKFGFLEGSISDISNAPMPTAPAVGADQPPVYQVKVRLAKPALAAYGKEWRLMPGMTVKADIVLEERTFLEWLFDPIRAAALRL